MRTIVQVAGFYAPTSGGLRTTVDALGRCYAEAGHRPVLVIPGAVDRVVRSGPVTVVCLRSPRLPGTPYRILADRRALSTALGLGHPAPSITRLDSYAGLCLDWYLGPDRSSAAILDIEGEVAGYALVGTAPGRQRRWTALRAARFATRTGLELLYASACLPGLLPPAVVDGHRHVDGGVLHPVPVQRAVELDATIIYVLGDDDVRTPPPGRLSALQVLLRSFAISRYTRLPDLATLAHPGQRVIVVRGASTAGIDIRDVSHTSRLLTESHALARAQLLAHAVAEPSLEPAGA